MIRWLRERRALRGIPRVTDAQLHEMADRGVEVKRMDEMWKEIVREIERRKRS